MGYKIFNGMLNLSKIDKSKIVKNKAGESVIWVHIIQNDEADQYGNTIAVKMPLSKEELQSGVKATYIGNFKEKVFNSTSAPAPAPAPEPLPSLAEQEENYDLPF